MRAPEVAKWLKYRVEWDGTDGRNVGAQQTVWEIVMDVERCDGKAKEGEQGAVALVLDLAKAFERVSLPWYARGRRTSVSRGRSCGCCAVISSTRGECSLKDVRRSRSRPSRPSCQVQVVLFASADCIAGCFDFVDDITALLNEVHREVAEMAKKVM